MGDVVWRRNTADFVLEDADSDVGTHSRRLGYVVSSAGTLRHGLVALGTVPIEERERLCGDFCCGVCRKRRTVAAKSNVNV